MLINLRTKKGVSPLIATVLLVAFSVALGAIIMNFSQKSTLDLAQETGTQLDKGVRCSFDLTINVFEIGNVQYMCYNRSNLKNFETIIENSGNVAAKGIQVFRYFYWIMLETHLHTMFYQFLIRIT